MATQTQIVRESPEVEAKKLGLMDSVKELADTPLDLPEYEVADLTDLQKDALARTGSMYDPTADIDAARQQLSDAEQLILASLGQDGGEGIRAAMNPYIEEVINRSIEQARENEALQQIALGDRANQLNAFGGSRADMISGVLSADTNKNILRDSAGLYADAFTDATGRIKDAASGIAGLSGQASGLSQLQQALEQQGIGFMFDVGTKEQAQDQAVLDAERMTETQDLYEPYKRLSFVSDIYAGAPSGSMTTVEGGGSGNEPSLFEKLFGTAVGVSSSAAGIQSLFG